MAFKWRGQVVTDRLREAQIQGVNATMTAAILHAKGNHQPGAHALGRFQTQTGSLERSVRIVRAAAPLPGGGGVLGTWGSKETVYAHRIEMGFQGKDRLGRVVNAQAYPYLRPAAAVEYPKLAKRIRRIRASL